MAQEAVVYVHGLWHQGPESWLLRHRLAAQGFKVHAYRYGSVSWPMARVCEGLREFVARIDAPVVHFLGHSLGGIVIHRYLGQSPPPQPGRAVLLGSPMTGSAAALGAVRFGVLRRLLGRCVAEELLRPQLRHWPAPWPLGLIAGTGGLGLGMLFTDFCEPHDGVVALSETRVQGASGHITLPVSHFGLLLSADVMRQTGAFLREGRFLPT